MKSAKFFICIALSFSFLLVGVGFAQVTASLDFTGNVSFQHTGLYISNIETTGNVNITGYSGTMLNLTAEAGATMTITVTNPLGDTYYYHEYTPGDLDLTIMNVTGDEPAALAVGDPVAPGGTITFTVTFDGAIANAQIVQFNFTLVPPALEEPDDDGNNTTNATAVLHFVIGEKGTTGIGLNNPNDDTTFQAWCNAQKITNGKDPVRVLHCLESDVTGTNLTNEFGPQSKDVYFTLEWVSATKYNIYLYSANDAVKENVDKYIVTYKQEILYNEIEELWYAPTNSSFKGYAMVVQIKNKVYGVEYNDTNVIWYAEPPSGAVVVE